MKIHPIHRSELIQFVEKNNLENAFVQDSFLTQPGIEIHGIFAKDGQQKGFFFTESLPRMKFLKSVATPRNMPNCQLTYVCSAKNPAKKNSELKNVMEAISHYVESLGNFIVSVSFPETWIDFQPFVWNKFKVTTRYTYQLDLSISEEELLVNLTSERRKNITKAQNDQLTTKEIEPNTVMLEMILSTFKRQNIPVNRHIVEKILFESKKENLLATMTYDTENRPLACNFCLIDARKATYLFGGYSTEHKHEGAGALALWRSIQLAKKREVAIFDFEGSMIPQIEKYFRGFGGELVPFYRVTKSSYLVEVLLKTKERTRF